MLFTLSTGPPLQAFVRISGSAVDETITSLPATVSFNINDDDEVVEENEVYFLTLTSDDPDVLIQQDTTQIMITDDDRMLLTYACAIHIQGYIQVHHCMAIKDAVSVKKVYNSSLYPVVGVVAI